MAEDLKFMEICIELSRKSVRNGNHPFGAILVRENKIILESENYVVTKSDCTLHAELNLVSRACQIFDKDILEESALYTSTEPCAMCSGAIYWSGISKVIYGCSGARLGKIAGETFVFS